MFPHTNFFNSSFSAFSALGGLLSWWRGRSGAAGWLWCTDWEQREQLMIAYQRPRFTPSSCFWEWASSTAPQRRACIWDLTFSNLIKLDEKKPSSAYDPPPTSSWNGMTLKVFLDDIIWKDSESEGTVVSLLQSDAERKRNLRVFFFFSFYDMIHWDDCTDLFHTVTVDTSSPWWQLHSQVNSLTKAAFPQQMMGENSGYYSRKLQHLNVKQMSPDAPEILMTEISQLHWATYYFFYKILSKSYMLFFYHSVSMKWTFKWYALNRNDV